MVDSPESGAVAGGGRDGVLDAAGDGPAQVAGEGQPRRRPLSPITLTGGLKRLGVRRASMILRSFAADGREVWSLKSKVQGPRAKVQGPRSKV